MLVCLFSDCSVSVSERAAVLVYAAQLSLRVEFEVSLLLNYCGVSVC